MKKLLIASVLAIVLVLSIAPVAFAHTHIDLPNGKCVDIPESRSDNAHDGIATAKANQSTPFSGGWEDSGSHADHCE